MSLFDGYSRDQLRLAYAQAWAKHLARSPLAPLEAQIVDVIAAHPEYAPIVGDADRAIGFEQDAAAGSENPFLHMGLHLAIREQLSIDRPPGVRQIQRALTARLGDGHDAEHVLMEALAETLWEAQRDGQPPDERRYLDRARAHIKARD